ncbi:MAG TPA: cytochrome P460 family protein [Pyrinomonadaceae bacterium]|nr:cytochrome P460 family protein [Pyrinomonadaceae bacterium]
MNKLSLLLLLPVIGMVGCALATDMDVPFTVADSDLATLAKYRQWTLVNPTPQLMEPLSAQSCAIIPGRQEPSPHLHKYISVFVNSVGREAMMTKQQPKFPVGSMVVKEKFDKPDSTSPELLTAMIKREAGYYPEGGDWEYLVLDGAASKIVERGKLTRCSGCHVPYKYSDFITRTYLPSDVRIELKP